MKQHIQENLLPLSVIVIFALATLFCTRQLLNHTAQLHARYVNNHAAAQDLGRAFNDFEASFLSYLGNDNRHTEENLRNGIHYLKKVYGRLYSTIQANGVDTQFMVHADGLKTDLDVLDNFFKPGAFESKTAMNEAAIASLYQIHTSLSDLSNDLVQDHTNAFNGDEMNQHRFALFATIFIMASSGIALIILLIFKIDRLEESGSDKEQTLKMLEDRMAAIELAADGIAIAEEDGRLSFVNRAFADTYGYTPSRSLVGRKWIDLCAEDIRETLENDVFSALSSGAFWTGTGTGLRQDGLTFRKSISISALPGRRWILVIRDVSDKIRAEELSSQRLAAIEAAGDGIGIADPKGNLIYMNHALKKLHELDEYQAQDLIGKPWSELYNDLGREQIQDKIIPALRGIGYWKGESPILTKNGNIVYAEMSLTRLPNGGLTGTARDITDRIKAEREKAELEKQFYQAQKMEAVGRLAGGIAHDFNNILAAIMGFAEFLMEDLPEESSSHRFARSIHDGGAQAKDVIERLLMFSRTHDHKMEAIDLRAKVEETLSLLRSSIPSTIRIDYTPGLSNMMINGNKTLITQAVMNLCVNARDAVGSAHGVINVAIQKSIYYGLADKYYVLGELEKGREYYALSINDNGSGMSREVMERIFDPFFTTKPVDKGTGLGLSSVHGIMASHEGAVAVASREGEGTEFILFFPVSEQAMFAMPFEQAVSYPVARLLSGKRVLVVDDQKDLCMMMTEMLTRLGYKTESYESAADALKNLSERPDDFAVVITDQTMPVMTGTELAREIERTTKNIPVILMSGFAAENLGETSDDISIIASILHKPINPNDLARAVGQALAARRQTAA